MKDPQSAATEDKFKCEGNWGASANCNGKRRRELKHMKQAKNKLVREAE